MERIRGTDTPETIGPFRVVRRLGAGGMAEAFEALRTGPGGFEQRVCVKRVLPAYSTDAELTRLFLREARVAAALSHRNVTRVVDFGEDRGCHYLALELVDGVDLRRLLKLVEARRVSIGVAVLIGVEVAEALEHAHTRGGKTGPVVHRDVSPANILVSTDGDVKLTDFGISKALNDAPITRSDFVRGNVWYMAPEQIDGSRSDPRSDLFSLGVVLYQCVSGRRPYHGATDLAAMMALSEGRRVPLADAAPYVPAALVAIIERLLSSDPAARLPTAAALVDALAPLADLAAARRELRALVRAHRDVRPKPRAVVAAAPITLELSAPEGDQEARTRPSFAVADARPAPTTLVEVPSPLGQLAAYEGDADHRRTTPARPAAPHRAEAAADPADRRTTPARPAHRAAAGESRPEQPEDRPGDAASEQAPPPEPRRHEVRPRWQRYALAPGAWASVDRAAEQREREGRPLLASHTEPVELPVRSGLWWTALAVVALAVAGLATCLLTLLA